MKLSVVIPAYNEERLLPDTLRHVGAALKVFEKAGWDTEIIVCDNNSTDRTGDIAHQSGAQVVFEPHNQIARARNRGAEAARGDWLVFVDADSSPSPALFADVLSVIGQGQYLGGGALVDMGPTRGIPLWLLRCWNSLSRRMQWMAGSFIFCETAAFRQLGGFNLDLYASEEIEFSKRLKKLAKSRQKRLIILDRHPLLTSPRKLRLYSKWEYCWFLFRCVAGGGSALRKRSACAPWYDGRR